MNTVSQTIAKLIILPLFGASIITGVALSAADSASAAPEWDPLPPAAAQEWDPPAPAATTAPAQPGPIEDAIRDGEVVHTAPAAPTRPSVILNGIRVEATTPAAPAREPRSHRQDSGTSEKNKDNAKSSEGDSPRQ